MKPKQTWNKSKVLVLFAAAILMLASCAALGQKKAEPGAENAPAEAAAPAAPTAQGGSNVLQGVEVQTTDQETDIVVTTASPATYTVYKLPDPNRIILDITDTSIGNNVQTTQAVNSAAISDIVVVGAGEQGHPVSRIQINLNADSEYDVRKQDGRLVVKVLPGPVGAGPEASVPEMGPPMPIGEAPAMEAGMPAPVPMPDATPEEPEAAPEPVLMPQPAPGPATGPALPAPSEGPLPAATQLLDIVTQREGDLLRVVIVADGSVGNIDVFTLSNPPRLVVDLMRLKSVYPQSRLDLQDPNVSSIRIGKHSNKVRLVLDMGGSGLLPYTTAKRGDQLIITIGQGAENAPPPETAPPSGQPSAPPPDLGPEPGPGLMPVPMPEPEASPELPAEQPGMMPSMNPPEASAEPETYSPVDLLGVDFDYTKEKSTVRIRTTGRAEYQMVTNDRDQLISVRLVNANIAPTEERSLDTSEFQSPVRMVSSYQWTSGAQRDVYVTLSLNFIPKYYVVREGNDILVILENPRTAGGVPLPQGRAEYGAGPGTDTEEFDPESATGPGGAQYYGGVGGSARRNFSGRVVYLDYNRIPVVDALSLLAEVAGLNLVISGDLKGTVSLKLEAVPWDQALDIILRTQKYGAVIRGNILRVAPLSELEEEERRFQERRKLKATELPLELRIIYINYADPSEIANQIKYILTPGRGRVEVDKRTNSILVWDVAINLDIIEKFVNRLDIETPQVLIEARIVEAQANLRNELGVRWAGMYHSGAAYGNPTGLNFPGTVDVGVGLVDGAITPAPDQALLLGETGVGLSLGSLTHAVNLDLLLRALETEQKIKIISSPRVVTLDSEEAQISQGVAIPFATTSASGTKTEFVDANLTIKVTPHVTSDRRIIMDVTASNNAPIEIAGATGPGINKAEATTRILIKDGETAVIGGIFVIEKRDTITRVPLLGKVPFVGWLFRDTIRVDNKRELLIFITPRILSGGPEYMQRQTGR